MPNFTHIYMTWTAVRSKQTQLIVKIDSAYVSYCQILIKLNLIVYPKTFLKSTNNLLLTDWNQTELYFLSGPILRREDMHAFKENNDKGFASLPRSSTIAIYI